MSYLTSNIKFKDSNLIDIKAEETFVGWYEGEKLYRKIIKKTSALAGGETLTVEHGIINLKRIIHYFGNVTESNLTYFLPYVFGSSTCNIRDISSANITILSNGSNWNDLSEWVIFLYFTKNE